MNLEGKFELPASRGEVWEALNNTAVLKECIPGCEELEKLSETEFEALVRAKIGPVNAKFKTEIVLRDVKPSDSYTLVAKSKGGAAGMGEGVARVELVEQPDGTELKYSVEFKVQGKLAQIGSRLLMNVIQKMSNEFFSKFAASFTAEQELEQETAAVSKQVEKTEANLKPLWIGVGILVAFLVFWYLSA